MTFHNELYAMAAKPRIFVASSKEAERLALAVQQNLEEEAEVTVWSQDAFRLGHTVIDELIRNLQRSHFGIFVFSPDDQTTIRGRNQRTVRDNVILELGMFLGRLGKERSFIIKPRQSPEMRLPTDLLGIVTGQYDGSREDSPRAALASACVQVADAIRQQLAGHSNLLNQLVENSLETVCRAMSVPITPEQASLRAFIFCKERDELVCRHFWDPNPSDEEVGRTRFSINRDTASRIVVVRCFLDDSTRRTEEPQGSDVEPLPKDFKGAKGKVKPDIRYVLATPIRNENGEVWGVVDFDASNDVGKALLQNAVSNTVMVRLAKHLSSVLC